tara:strand:+ start:917 stop:1663 length:747 start_codon:yes stop_codon:yes gene_type:complete
MASDSVLIAPVNLGNQGQTVGVMPWLSSVVLEWDYSASYEGVGANGAGIIQTLSATSTGSQTLTGDITRQVVQVGINAVDGLDRTQMNQGLAAAGFRSFYGRMVTDDPALHEFGMTSATDQYWEWQELFAGVLNGQADLSDGTDTDPLCIVTNGKANITDCGISQTFDGLRLDIQISFNGVGFADPTYEPSLFTNKVVIQQDITVAPADLYGSAITFTVNGVTGLTDPTITTDTTSTDITLTLTKATV